MPLRSFSREQVWLFPPRLDEWVPVDHAVRFIASLVDALPRAVLQELGIAPDGEPYGAPAYHPRVLLCVWLYGFMTGTRSGRKLEAACRDNIAYLWLTGCQYPDHNTLWRFYKAHRTRMRKLLKRTVRTAIRLGLIDLAVPAIDGTKIAANAALRARSMRADSVVTASPARAPVMQAWTSSPWLPSRVRPPSCSPSPLWGEGVGGWGVNWPKLRPWPSSSPATSTRHSPHASADGKSGWKHRPGM